MDEQKVNLLVNRIVNHVLSAGQINIDRWLDLMDNPLAMSEHINKAAAKSFYLARACSLTDILWNELGDESVVKNALLRAFKKRNMVVHKIGGAKSNPLDSLVNWLMSNNHIYAQSRIENLKVSPIEPHSAKTRISEKSDDDDDSPPYYCPDEKSTITREDNQESDKERQERLSDEHKHNAEIFYGMTDSGPGYKP